MDRSTLPSQLVEQFELIDREHQELWDREPLLPAPVTPELIREAALGLHDAIEEHRGSQSALFINEWRRSLIADAIAGTLTEPVSREQRPSNARFLDASRRPEEDGLFRAFERFDQLLWNVDWTTPENREDLLRVKAAKKKRQAELWGRRPPLSDDEWRDL